MTDDVLQPWREYLATRTVTLEGGRQIVVRTVTLDALVARGTIPLLLFNESMEASAQRRQKGGKGIDENFLKMLPSINALIMAAAVSPRVVDGPADIDNGVISIDDLTIDDRMTLFNDLSGAARALRPFRRQSRRDADAVPDGNDVPPAAE